MSNPNPFFRYSAIATVVLLAVVYLFASFINMSFFPSDWGMKGRIIAILSYTAAWVFGLVVVAGLIDCKIIGRGR